MAIDFTKKGSTTAAAPSKEDRPRAKFWLNIGYEVEVPEKEAGAGSTTQFVSLPVGMPLDVSDKLAIKGSNAEFLALQTARNDLLEQLLAHAEASLKPGEDQIIELKLQLRRVKEEAAPILPADNPFAAKIKFG